MKLKCEKLLNAWYILHISLNVDVSESGKKINDELFSEDGHANWRS